MSAIPPRGIGPIEEPNKADVLFGRGSHTNEHRGNVRMRTLVVKARDQYFDKTATNIDKLLVVDQIRNQIRKEGGRFLKKDTSSDQKWWDVGDEAARKKITKVFSDLSKQQKRAPCRPGASPSSSIITGTTNDQQLPSSQVSSSAQQADRQMLSALRTANLQGISSSFGGQPSTSSQLLLAHQHPFQWAAAAASSTPNTSSTLMFFPNQLQQQQQQQQPQQPSSILCDPFVSGAAHALQAAGSSLHAIVSTIMFPRQWMGAFEPTSSEDIVLPIAMEDNATTRYDERRKVKRSQHNRSVDNNACLLQPQAHTEPCIDTAADGMPKAQTEPRVGGEHNEVACNTNKDDSQSEKATGGKQEESFTVARAGPCPREELSEIARHTNKDNSQSEKATGGKKEELFSSSAVEDSSGIQVSQETTGIRATDFVAQENCTSTSTAGAMHLDSQYIKAVENAAAGMESNEMATAFLLSALRGDDFDSMYFTPEQEKREKLEMSEEDRVQVLADLFGDLCEIEPPRRKRVARDEEASFNASELVTYAIQSLVSEMRLEIERTPMEEKEALVMAQKKSFPTEFSDERLELFLRFEKMEPQPAAKRFITYWTKRLHYFGPDKFHLPMTLSGALRDDKVALRAGVITMLSRPDASGRPILLYEATRHTRDGYTLDSMLRAIWYMLEAFAQLPNAGKGVVAMANAMNMTLWAFDRQMDAGAMDIVHCMPFEFCGLHSVGMPTALAKVLKPVSLAFFSKRERARFIVHDTCGDALIEALAGYGIGREVLPVHMGGSSPDNHVEWLEKRAREGK